MVQQIVHFKFSNDVHINLFTVGTITLDLDYASRVIPSYYLIATLLDLLHYEN